MWNCGAPGFGAPGAASTWVSTRARRANPQIASPPSQHRSGGDHLAQCRGQGKRLICPPAWPQRRTSLKLQCGQQKSATRRRPIFPNGLSSAAPQSIWQGDTAASRPPHDPSTPRAGENPPVSSAATKARTRKARCCSAASKRSIISTHFSKPASSIADIPFRGVKATLILFDIAFYNGEVFWVLF